MAVGFLFAQTILRRHRSAVLGVTGLLLAAVGATCGISLLSGTSDAFAWGNLTRVALGTAAGFVLLGIGITTIAWDLNRFRETEPAWVPIGASCLVAIVRIGLWQAFAAKNPTNSNLLSNLTLLGGLSSAILLGVMVHLALKAHYQREALRTANRRLEEEMVERKQAEEAAHAANRAKSEFLGRT